MNGRMAGGILRISAVAAACAFSAACGSGVRFDIEGRLADRAASKVYLVVEKTTADTLATAEVDADNRFRLTGEAVEPSTAFVCDDNGNTLATLLIEESPLRLRYSVPDGYIVEGGPVNDKFNIVVRRLASITREVYTLDPRDSASERRYEELAAKYRDIVSTAVGDNMDNIIGVELFLGRESKGMSADAMRRRFGEFPPKMRELSSMRRFADYIEVFERTEVGQPYIDVDLHALSGMTKLSEICGGGRWVLLDFWATWCDPCVRELPYLREAYSLYALQGFEICSVSLDRDIDRWREFVRRNDMLWTNAIDVHGGEPYCAAETYGLQSIPSNFLISPEGEIVARNLRGEGLLRELKRIFGN